ncbi:MAG TPA: glycine cleavage system protein GcvH [Massilibacterium sp.]|nr:glycine cleavage system protein GcvH [Massilibacterium sp.]
MKIKDTLFYSKDHTWLQVDGDKVRIGITDFLQDDLGTIVFVDLVETTKQLKVSEALGNVESEKTVSELYTPVSGTVIAVNKALDDEPNLINISPYDKGWLIEVELMDELQLDDLLTASEYAAFLKEDE